MIKYNHLQLGQIIKNQGLTLTRAAELSGLSKGFLSRLCKGEAEPSVFSLAKLCNALQIQPNDVFTLNDTISQTRVERAEISFSKAVVEQIDLFLSEVKRSAGVVTNAK